MAHLHSSLRVLAAQTRGKLLSFDGFWTSDDLGHQKQLFVSPQVFRTFHKPCYERIGELLREHE